MATESEDIRGDHFCGPDIPLVVTVIRMRPDATIITLYSGHLFKKKRSVECLFRRPPIIKIV